MRVAFAGNPNSGKTTLFNVLTGRNEKVGNWAGVTVGKKEGEFKPEFGPGYVAVDLPGAYSMSPFTPEESITSGFIRNENPDVIINIVDATNLSRSLFFTSQLLEMGIPMIVALNKVDINRKEGVVIDTKALSEKLGCPVIETVSTNAKDEGLKELAAAIDIVCKQNHGQKAPFVQGDIDLHSKEAVDKADRERFAFVNGIVSAVETRKVKSSEISVADKVDNVITNPVVGILLFAVIMWAVFAISQTYLGPWIAGYLTGWIESFQGLVEGWTENSPAIVQTLLGDGIVGGVGAVVGFLPLIMVMFFLIALLEDCGYMARVTAVMDPIFKKVGLSGKSIISMIIGTGCGVPAIMSTRTIRDERERRTIAMLTTWIPCGAKVPVIALFAGAFFSGASWVSLISYITGVLLIFLGALLVKSVTGYKYRKSFFIMEMPKWSVPSLKRAFFTMLDRAKAYIVKAATIILVCNCVVTIMANYNWHFQMVAEDAQDTSILASIATPFAILLIPLGFGAWQLAAAAITGFIAKENVVGTIAVVYGITRFIDVDELVMTGGANDIALAMGLTSVSAIAYLFFNLFTPPCFAAIGAMNSEMQHKGWLFSAIGLQLCTGYAVAFLINQVGTLVTTGSLAAGFIPGLIAIIVMAIIVVVMARKIRASFDETYKLNNTTVGAM